MADVVDPSSADHLASRTSRWLLCSVSFWGGLQIMALEICGFRVLQTNLGTSVLVTGTLLTLMMVVLSIGYYAGGRLSARFRNVRGLFGLLVIAGLYTEGVTSVFFEPISTLGLHLHTALGAHAYLRYVLPAGVLTLMLYGPPVLLMSMITPYWIGLVSDADSRANPGRQSGFVMTLSTLGSIVGTLLASYLVVPVIGPAAAARASNAVFLALVLGGGLWAMATTPAAWLARTVAR